MAPELYDLERDPAEMVNCATGPAYASVLADMKRRLDRQVKKMGLTPRENHLVVSPCLLEPILPDQEAAVVARAFEGEVRDGVRITVGMRTVVWREVKPGKGGNIPVGKLLGDKGDERFLLG